MAGLDGVKNKIDPSQCGWGPFDFNLYSLSDEEKAKILKQMAICEETFKAEGVQSVL